MNDARLTFEDSHGFLKDLFERLASYRGPLWHEAFKRFLVATNPEFYMLEIGQLGTAQLLLERFHQAGFSISPHDGVLYEALRNSKPESIYMLQECFRMLPVRAMGPPTAYAVRGFGHTNGCVATSWEAACRLLLEVEEKPKQGFHSPRRLLNFAPTPVVWTFVGGDHKSRASLATISEQSEPMLVALVSADSGLKFKGIVEAEYMYRCLDRDSNQILPSDVFLFSINTKN
ncbi:MAG: hypothetical protein HYR90_01580 [Candidatus Andersenbacteria bacterium]|nr:hypothetical protein [Candidatus Andersenbacteria bacterium]MBI3250849.1 hypothetical protein [Candidatus Andersenbacteria bacterium]